MSENNVKLPDTTQLIVSTSPHMHSGERISNVMAIVILALLPACITGIYFFGLPALKVIILCSLFSVLCEWVCCQLLQKKSTLNDMSALLTGILLALNLSPSSSWWICLVGSVLAIGLGKQIYGGLGYNPFNPALVARVGLLIAFPSQLTHWLPTSQGGMSSVDAFTSATPLAFKSFPVDQKKQFVQALGNESYFDLFTGNVGGCIGETSALALLIGGVLLIYKKLIRWQIPVFFILTVLTITGAAHWFNPNFNPPPMFHLFSGGLFLGAFFMATDMVTSPMTKKGAIIFGLGCGLITSVIRIWGSYPEGVSFSILFMNALTPLIDRFTGGTPFGKRKKEEQA